MTLLDHIKLMIGTKLTSLSYCEVFDQTLFKWYNSQSLSFKKKFVFMHDNNASSHAANDIR